MAVNETQKHKGRQTVDMSRVYGNSSRGAASLFAPNRLENSFGDTDQKGYDTSSLLASDELYPPIIWGRISQQNGVNMIIDADADQKFAEMYIQFKKSATPGQIDVFFRLRKIPDGLYNNESTGDHDYETIDDKIKSNLDEKSKNLSKYFFKMQILYYADTIDHIETTDKKVQYSMQGLNDCNSFRIKEFSVGDGISPSIITAVVDGDDWFFKIYPKNGNMIGRYSIEAYSDAESLGRKDDFFKSFSKWLYKKNYITTNEGNYISPIVKVKNEFEAGLISKEKYKATTEFWESASRGDIQINGLNYSRLSSSIKQYMFEYFKENYHLSDVDASREVDRNFSEESELSRSRIGKFASLKDFFHRDGFKNVEHETFQDTQRVEKNNTIGVYSGLEPAKNLEFLSYYFKIGDFGDDMQIFFSDSDNFRKVNMFFYYWSGVDRKGIRVDVGEVPSPRGFLSWDFSVNDKLTNSQSIAFNFEKSGLNSAEADMIISQSIFAGPSLVEERDKNASLDPNFDADIYINFYFPSANKDWVSKGKITKLIQKRNGSMVGERYSRDEKRMSEEMIHHASSYMARSALALDVENKMQQLNYELTLLISEIFMKQKAYGEGSSHKILSDDLYSAWFDLNNSFGVEFVYHKEKKFTNKDKRLIDKDKEFTQRDVDRWAKFAKVFLYKLAFEMGSVSIRHLTSNVSSKKLISQIKNKEWLLAKESYRVVTDDFVHWLRSRSHAVRGGNYGDLFKQADSKDEALSEQLEKKGNVSSLLVQQHNKGRDLIPVKAVFYSNEAYLMKTGDGYRSLDQVAVPMSVYYFYEDGAWKVVNLSSGTPHVVQAESEHVVPTEEFLITLFKKLEAQEDWAPGKMVYEMPFYDVSKEVNFKGSWGWDDIIKATGYGFFLAGLLASLILTDGATLPIVLDAIGALGVITGTAIHLRDGFMTESLTTKSIVADMADILASLMPLANFGWALVGKSANPTRELFVPLVLDSGVNGVSFVLTNEADLTQIISLIDKVNEGNGDSSTVWQLFGLMTYLMVKNTLSRKTLKSNIEALDGMDFMETVKKTKGVPVIPKEKIPAHLFKD